METMMTLGQRKRCEALMVDVVKDLVSGHSDEIVDTLNELYDSCPDKKAGLDVPVVLRVKRDEDIGYTFSGKIDIRKVEHIKDERDPVNYNPNLPDLPGFEDGKIPKTKKPAAVINGDQLPMDKPGDNAQEKGDCKGVFVFGGGRTATIVDYEDVKGELAPEVLKKDAIFKGIKDGKCLTFTQEELLELADLPEGNFLVIRARKPDTDEIGYFMQKLPAAAAETKPEADICGHPHADGKRVCTKPSGHDGRHSYGQRPAEPIEPSPGESATESSNAPEDIEEPEAEPEESIALFLTRHGLALADVEAHLRREGKLGFTKALKDCPKVCDYVRKNIGVIKQEMKKSA